MYILVDKIVPEIIYYHMSDFIISLDTNLQSNDKRNCSIIIISLIQKKRVKQDKKKS